MPDVKDMPIRNAFILGIALKKQAHLVICISRLYVKFDCQDFLQVLKHQMLTAEMLSTIDESLSNNNELTTRRVKTHLCERFTDLADV